MDIELEMYDDGRDQDYMRWLEYQKFSRDEESETRKRRKALDETRDTGRRRRRKRGE